MPEVQKLPIQFIHPSKPFMNDHIYGTGRWEPDEIKLVDPSTAAKMIRHIDVYAPATAEDAAKAKAVEVKTVVKKTEETIDDNATQDLRDSVMKMERDAVIEYAAVHYSLKIPGNSSTENARKALIQHIDQAGPQ